MGVSKNRGTPKSSILIGFSIFFSIHFGVPLFLETTSHTSKNKVSKEAFFGSEVTEDRWLRNLTKFMGWKAATS